MTDNSAALAAVSAGAGERKINICSINEMVTCKICSGYLVDATTVTECLHTFCKSCIVKHLEDNIHCPECEVMIHQSHPLDYIAFDRTMQDIVYKLVPGLEQSEYKREREFYDERGLPCPKDMEAETEKDDIEMEDKEETPEAENTLGSGSSDGHRFEEQVNLHLESADPSKLRNISRKFVRVSSMATITHLKKFLAIHLMDKDDPEAYRDIDVTCDGELIPKDHTLKFVYITRWRTKDPPLKLLYGPKINIEEEDIKKGSVPEWKLQPKVSYDDDEGDD